MNLSSDFTPEEIARLVKGEHVSKSKKTSASSPDANKIKEETPYTPEVRRASFHVPINDKVDVSRPNIYDRTGRKVSPDSVVSVNPAIFDRLDEEARATERELAANRKAQYDLKTLANPEQLLNQLNATRRCVEKLQKEVAELKKAKE